MRIDSVVSSTHSLFLHKKINSIYHCPLCVLKYENLLPFDTQYPTHSNKNYMDTLGAV